MPTLPITPYSTGQRWFCDHSKRPSPGADAHNIPPFTFIILGPGRSPNHKKCRVEYDPLWLEARGYHGGALEARLRTLGSGLESEYKHTHLKKCAELVIGVPVSRQAREEPCCRCYTVTPYWTDLLRDPDLQVPLCALCSPFTHPAQVPSKKGYRLAVQYRAGQPTGAPG